MKQNPEVDAFTSRFLNKKRPKFNVGDTVRVHTKVIEGKKERIQVYTGIVIARKRGGVSETFTVYRQAYGCNMERVFLFNSPRVVKVEVERRGKTRRATLYNLRNATGKKARVEEDIRSVGVEAKPMVDSKTLEKEVIEEKEAPEEKPKKEKKAKAKEEKPKKEKAAPEKEKKSEK